MGVAVRVGKNERSAGGIFLCVRQQIVIVIVIGQVALAVVICVINKPVGGVRNSVAVIIRIQRIGNAVIIGIKTDG